MDKSDVGGANFLDNTIDLTATKIWALLDFQTLLVNLAEDGLSTEAVKVRFAELLEVIVGVTVVKEQM